MRKIYALLAVMGFAFTLKAQLVFNENFTGYPLGNLDGSGSWVANADPNPDVQVAGTTGMIVSGYTSGGGYVTVNGTSNGKDDYKLFSAPISATGTRTVFMSFVVRVAGAATSTSTATDYSVTLTNTANGALPCRFYVRWQNGNNRRIFGVGVGSETPAYFNTGNSSSTQSFLIVIRYDINVGAGNDVAYMWINPALTTTPPSIASADASSTAGTGEVAYGTQFDALMIHQSGGNSPDADFDGFRVASGVAAGPFTAAENAWSALSPAGAPLPVKLDNFDAAKDASGVKLTWLASDEIGVSKYQIERSQDGLSFEAIGSVTAERKKTYSFTDMQPVGENNFYRLKMIDLDGNYKLSHVVSIKSKLSLNIVLSPNPVKDMLLVQHPKVTGNSSLQLMNADGRTLINKIIPANAVQTSIDLSSFRGGLYFVVFQNESGAFSKTILKK